MNRRIRRTRRPARPRPVLVESSAKLTPKEFTILAIERRRLGPGRGIHVVCSGFNAAFRAYFPKLDVVAEMERLAEEGVIDIIPSRWAVTIAIAQPEPPNPLKGVSASGVQTLVAMGLAS